MAKLSKTLISSGIPQKYKDEMSKCCFCGDQITRGGMWAGKEHHLGICEKCSLYLIDWYVDALMDTSSFGAMDLDQKKKEVCSIVEKRLEKKERLLEEMDRKKGLNKLGIKYYSELGIIDFFGLTLSAEELKGRLDDESSYGSNLDIGYGTIEEEDIDRAIEQVTSIVTKEWGEPPHIIRFFGIPVFDNLSFTLCIIAKIENNGSTIVFTKNKKVLEKLDSGYLDIFEII